METLSIKFRKFYVMIIGDFFGMIDITLRSAGIHFSPFFSFYHFVCGLASVGCRKSSGGAHDLCFFHQNAGRWSTLLFLSRGNYFRDGTTIEKVVK